MFRYKWHVLVMLLLSMVGFSMVNAYTINVENRDPFGTLNLSTLMIKPNANSDSTIELSGHTIRIKTSEENTGKIRVGLVCNESGTSCKDVQTLLRYGDIEWKQIPISGTLSKVLLPESTGSNVWIGKSTDLGAITEADEKLWVIGKTRLEGDLTVSGGKITVYQICDETGKCKKVSELYTGNGGGGGGDTYWHINTYDPEYGDATVLYPNGLYNVWIGNPDPMPAEANPYKLRVLGKTKLDGDLLVTGGNITVYEICDETGKCKKVSELYTGNGVGGGGGDVYWQLNGDILSTSGGSYGVNLNSNLNVAGSLNAGNLNTRGLNVTGNLNFAWANSDDGGYNTVSTTKGSLHVGSSLEVMHDLTTNGTTTAKGNITVSGGQVRVNEICDKGGSNCRRVSQITTGDNYWKIKNNTRNLTMSFDDYGLDLSTQYNAGVPQKYSFEIKVGTGTRAKLNIHWGGVDLRGNTTLNNALTVKGNANLQSGLTVTGGTTLNNDLTVEGNTTLNNALTVEGDANLNSGLHVNGDLYVESIMGTPPTQQIKTLLSLKTGDMTIDVNTTVKQKLDVEKNLNVEKNTTLKSGVVVKTLLSGQSYPTDALSISNNSDGSKAKMNFTGDAEINDGILKITSKEVNTPWDIRTMSQITLTPSNSSSYNKFGDNFHENFSVTDLAPCNTGREGTITYYRKIDDDGIYSYGYFKGCVCSYKYNSKTSNNISSFSCHWLNLNQKLYQENGVWNTISDID